MALRAGPAVRVRQGAIVVVFHRLGPYHVARLRALAEQMDTVCLELSRTTREYEWEEVHTDSRFQRLTLCEDSRGLSAGEFRGRLAGVLERLQPKVVAFPGWSEPSVLAGLEWAARNPVSTVLMSETTAWDAVRRPAREAVKRAIVGLFATALVGGSAQRDYLVELGMPAARIFLGYDAVDNEYFGQKAEGVRRQKLEVRRKLALPEQYFLASARFIEKKNLPRLLQAYALYRKKSEVRSRKSESISDLRPPTFDHWSLVLLGDGPLKAALCRLISDLSLQGSVHLPGFQQYPDLPAYYGLASAFVHASTTEQWGLVVNEAMASGLPVLVASRCGCAPDLVQEGVNGFTFDSLNVEQLSELMLKVSAFNFPLSSFGSGSQRIIAEWGPERFAGGLKAAVEKAIEVGPVRPTALQRMLLFVLARLADRQAREQ